MRTALALLASGVAAASAAACSTPYNPSTQYDAPRTYTPTHAKSFSIRYASSYKVFNTTVNGVNYITTLSVCGAPLPTPSSLGLGASDVLLSQLSQPITAAGITSVTYVPYLTVSAFLCLLRGGRPFYYLFFLRTSAPWNPPTLTPAPFSSHALVPNSRTHTTCSPTLARAHSSPAT